MYSILLADERSTVKYLLGDGVAVFIIFYRMLDLVKNCGKFVCCKIKKGSWPEKQGCKAGVQIQTEKKHINCNQNSKYKTKLKCVGKISKNKSNRIAHDVAKGIFVAGNNWVCKNIKYKGGKAAANYKKDKDLALVAYDSPGKKSAKATKGYKRNK